MDSGSTDSKVALQLKYLRILATHLHKKHVYDAIIAKGKLPSQPDQLPSVIAICSCCSATQSNTKRLNNLFRMLNYHEDEHMQAVTFLVALGIDTVAVEA
jgi:hypothetical protein